MPGNRACPVRREAIRKRTRASRAPRRMADPAGGTGDPSQPGSQLGVPVHHLVLPHHHHDLTAAVIPHIGDERPIRQRSGSHRMNGRGDRRLRRSHPRHQGWSERGPHRDRTQCAAMLQEPTARLISHGTLHLRNKPAPSAMSERGHTALHAGGSTSPTRRFGPPGSTRERIRDHQHQPH